MSEMVFFERMMVRGRMMNAVLLQATTGSSSVLEKVIGGIVIVALVAFLIFHKMSQNKLKQLGNDKGAQAKGSQFEVPQQKKETKATGEPGKKGIFSGIFSGNSKKDEHPASRDVNVNVPKEDAGGLSKEIIKDPAIITEPDGGTPTVDLSTYNQQGLNSHSKSNETQRVYVTGINGSMYGTSFWITEDGVTFGRDASCTYRYPNEETSISRFHCILYSAEGMLCIMDNGSVNGTFLEDGHRLQAKEPEYIGLGARFYLGTPDNMFEIRSSN